MRGTFVLFVVLGISATVSAQAPGQRDTSFVVSISEGTSRAGLDALTTPYATGGPWAAVPARAVTAQQAATVTDFRIRAWVEGTAARVLVFAVARRPDGTTAETQIASIALTPGESEEIRATEKYNARPVTISVSPRQ